MRGEEVAERELEPLEVVRAPRRREVELVSDLVGTVDDAGEAANEDVGDPVALEGGEDGVGVERRGAASLRAGLGSGAEKLLDSALRRAEHVLAQARERRVVARRKLERKVEAADADKLEQGLEAGCRPALFPAGDHGSLAAAPLGKLVLGETRSKPGLAYQISADHRGESMA